MPIPPFRIIVVTRYTVAIKLGTDQRQVRTEMEEVIIYVGGISFD